MPPKKSPPKASTPEALTPRDLFVQGLKIINAACGAAPSLTFKEHPRGCLMSGFFNGSEAIVSLPIPVDGLSDSSVTVDTSVVSDVIQSMSSDITLVNDSNGFHIQAGRTKASLIPRDGGYFPTIKPLESSEESPVKAFAFTQELAEFMQGAIPLLAVEQVFSTMKEATLLMSFRGERRIMAVYDPMQLAYIREKVEGSDLDLDIAVAYKHWASLISGLPLVGAQCWVSPEEFVAIGPSFKVRRLLPILQGVAAPDRVLSYLSTVASSAPVMSSTVRSSEFADFVSATRPFATTGEAIEFHPVEGKGLKASVKGMSGSATTSFPGNVTGDAKDFGVNYKFVTTALSKSGVTSKAKKPAKGEADATPATVSIDLVGGGNSARFKGPRVGYVCLLQAERPATAPDKGKS